MKFNITDKNGITLKTKGKFCKEDISVTVDESLMDITPTGTYEVVENGEYDITEYAKVNVNVASSGGNTLKKLLDYTKSTSYMFYRNRTIKDLTDYLTYEDTENVNGMDYMFYKADNLEKIRLNTIKVTSMNSMFYQDYSIETIDISHFNMSTTSSTYMWCKECLSLKIIIIRNFGANYVLDNSAFSDCFHLNGTVNGTYNPTGAKDGYIYVPRNMCDTLKSSTNWSTYADQIRALEDYTVDGTTTGDLDESKVNA